MNKEQETLSFDIKSLSVPVSILLVGVMVSLALFFGLKGKDSSGQVAGEVAGNLPSAPQQAEPETAKVSIDDDAIMGDKSKATVAIVGFSDYECPFCNQFRTQALGQIKKDYIDTGKAIFVFRDLPLPFHNPAAEREAMAVECAREQGGDQAYYQYHDLVFETTPGNGGGIDIAGLGKLAADIGLDSSKLKSCLIGEKYKDEVAKDLSDAANAGINGTPAFVIGKLGKDGSVEGPIVVGAQPYESFKVIIDQQLE
ncbi:DsbA family protein [Patescibacteria group bacterium]|nr:DsbA family protein [Patescibacteria group bacterium]